MESAEEKVLVSVISLNPIISQHMQREGTQCVLRRVYRELGTLRAFPMQRVNGFWPLNPFLQSSPLGGTSIVPISLMKKLRFKESLSFSITQHLVILAGVFTVSLP